MDDLKHGLKLKRGAPKASETIVGTLVWLDHDKTLSKCHWQNGMSILKFQVISEKRLPGSKYRLHQNYLKGL